jgi:hypothetical protein
MQLSAYRAVAGDLRPACSQFEESVCLPAWDKK